MEQTTWIFLGVLAASISAVTLFTDLEDILGGFVGAIAWALWGFGATNVETVTGCCVHTESYPALALFGGVGMGGLMLLVMLVGAGKILDPRGEDFLGEQSGR